mmetsp:Transcript_8965/g.16151  ORF Transcript_8965/g.16151 Transcript_8965/m.16151 type:complete len:201 (+) Transcript_8965:383-985(+)
MAKRAPDGKHTSKLYWGLKKEMYPIAIAASKFHITVVFKSEKMPTITKGYHLFFTKKRPQKLDCPSGSPSILCVMSSINTGQSPQFMSPYAQWSWSTNLTKLSSKKSKLMQQLARRSQTENNADPSSCSRCGKCIKAMYASSNIMRKDIPPPKGRNIIDVHNVHSENCPIVFEMEQRNSLETAEEEVRPAAILIPIDMEG